MASTSRSSDRAEPGHMHRRPGSRPRFGATHMQKGVRSEHIFSRIDGRSIWLSTKTVSKKSRELILLYNIIIIILSKTISDRRALDWRKRSRLINGDPVPRHHTSPIFAEIFPIFTKTFIFLLEFL